jgi:uncharacterized protein YecE (DUF72 family)
LGRVKVGTSGWSYDHWVGPFYPKGLGSGRRLEHYAGRLPTVEIDGTFYRLPSEDTVRAWAASVPEAFAFAVKGTRFITQFHRLNDVDEQVATFLARMGLLGEKLEVVLWQLPPNLKRDDELLERFLGLMPEGGPRHAVEFRHDSWLDDDVFAILRAHAAAQVHVSSDKMPVELTPTADFVYVRFHDTASYHGRYLEPALEPWARFLADQAAAGRDCYAYFNNDAQAHAPADAMRLIGMLGEDAYRLGSSG